MAPEQLSCRALKENKRFIAKAAHIAVPAEAGRRGDWRPLVLPSYSWKLMAPNVQLEDLAHLRQKIQTILKANSARAIGWQTITDICSGNTHARCRRSAGRALDPPSSAARGWPASKHLADNYARHVSTVKLQVVLGILQTQRKDYAQSFT